MWVNQIKNLGERFRNNVAMWVKCSRVCVFEFSGASILKLINKLNKICKHFNTLTPEHANTVPCQCLGIITLVL